MYAKFALKCPIVDSGFKKLNQTIHAIIIQSIQIDVFLCSLIQFLDKNANTTTAHNIADLDNVIAIATSHNIESIKLRFLLGFFMNNFKSWRVHHHNNKTKGKNATKKYP